MSDYYYDFIREQGEDFMNAWGQVDDEEEDVDDDVEEGSGDGLDGNTGGSLAKLKEIFYVGQLVPCCVLEAKKGKRGKLIGESNVQIFATESALKSELVISQCKNTYISMA